MFMSHIWCELVLFNALQKGAKQLLWPTGTLAKNIKTPALCYNGVAWSVLD
jgi:hypothetical protein